jgi:hypothetical protein
MAPFRPKPRRRSPLRLVVLLLLVVAIPVGALTGRGHKKPKRLFSSGKVVAAHACKGNTESSGNFGWRWIGPTVRL